MVPWCVQINWWVHYFVSQYHGLYLYTLHADVRMTNINIK
jgi:hypothetical protein